MNWNWLRGRKLSLGRVIDVFGETATVVRGDDTFRISVDELLEADYRTQDRVEADLSEALNYGNGIYQP